MILSIFSNIFFWIFLYGIAFISFILMYTRSKDKKNFHVKSGTSIVILNYTITGSIFLGPIILALTSQPYLPIPRIISILLGLLFVIPAAYIQIKSRMKIGFLPGGPFPDLRKEKSLINTGIYGLIRHPIYLGFILWQIGIAILMDAAYALIFFIFYILSYFPIIYLEEKELIQKYGKQYQEYKKKTPYMIIPKII